MARFGVSLRPSLSAPLSSIPRLVRELAMGALPLVALSSIPACTASTEVASLELRDPYGLIDDVAAAGNGLRVYVLPAAAYSCSTDGVVTPDVPDVGPGEVADAVVDITIAVDTATDSATGEAGVPAGSWTVLVEGRGVDAVTMVPNVVIASGCTTLDMVTAGETRDVAITLLPQTGSGICNDGNLSADEQCEPAGTPLCDAMCRTIPQPLNTSATAMNQNAPRLSARAGRRTAAVFDTDRADVHLRMLDPDGATIFTPGLLERDATVDSISGGLPSLQLGGHPAVAPDGRIAIPVTDYAMGETNSDVRLVLLTEDRALLGGGPLQVQTDRAMAQRAPVSAFAGTGALMVAFEDTGSSTGISAAHFAAGSTTPTAEAAEVGRSGGAAPALAAHDSGFVLAFTASDDVLFQRFGADGSPTDATPRPVLDSTAGVQSQPAVAALGNGTFAVAWRDADLAADGAGTAIRARIFGSDGTPVGAAFTVNTTTPGDQVAPTVAAADGRFLFAWGSGAEVRARLFDATGNALRNRERMPDTNDFSVAAGNASTPSAIAVGSGATAAWLIGYAAPTDGAGDVLARRYPR